LLLLLAANLIENIAETFYIAYRAIGRYRSESYLAAAAALLQLTAVIVAVMAHQDTDIVALAFLVGKGIQLAVVVNVIGGMMLGAHKYRLLTINSCFRLAKRAKAYALDALLGSAFGNIDSIVLRTCVGVGVVGVYQSGMRIFQGGAQAAPILANVFLPTMARQGLGRGKNADVAKLLQSAFLGVGAVFGLILAYFAEQITNFAFGPNYEQLITLLPLFGLLFFVRFFASAWGVILTAAGHQSYRAKVSALHLIFLLVFGVCLTNFLQAKGWLVALILANLLLGFLFMVEAIRKDLGVSVTFGVIAAVVGLLFFPSLL
jgi:O-antigen/teichoic acid export membrane protein